MSKILKMFFTAMLVISCSAMLFAHGKKDIEEKSVTNLNSWQEEFDLEGKKEGKLNLYVTASDMGGNTHVEGPFNIVYDKYSDLPVCGITNPFQGMRVVGNLNIVGTCIDDDGVSKVELVLDEGTELEQTVTAEGTEFWSYYLDTNDLPEGPHTIRVIGYDTNDEPRVNDPKKVKADHSTVTWQLDRHQPVTDIESHGMGMLVSGNIKLEGHVSDGNGISELSYSTDNGEHFSRINLSKTRDTTLREFSLSIDTKKFNDGAKVIWFRAVDEAGSTGLYSFLFFIDNTKPDVKIVYPEKDATQNGLFTVAGFAKDTIGITKLSWTFGAQTGDIDLIPGNPYWAVNVDSTGMKEKSAKFIIHAVDRVSNIVDVSQTIPLNQEEDKAAVQMYEPLPGQIYVGEDRLIVRGFATDDDAVNSVKIQLDGGEAVEQFTKGDFELDLAAFADLSVGKHKVTVTAVDVNGLEGNPVVTEIDNKGFAPAFGDARVTVGKEYTDFEDGMEIHPESGSVFSVIANSPIGIKQVYTKLSYGSTVFDEKTTDLKNVASYTASLPVVPGTPKGVVQYTVIAKDSYERTTEYNAIIYVTNTSKISSNDIKIVFSDSTVAEDGSIIIDRDHPVTGYVIGGKAKSVELVPETPFATAKLYGNQIRFSYGKHDAGIGSSDPITVRVTTDKDHVVEYPTPLVFKDDTAVPSIKLNNKNITNQTVDGRDGFVEISGSVTCPTGVGKFQYRIYSAALAMDPKNGTIASFKANPVPGDFVDITVEPLTGNFRFPVDTSSFIEGMYVVELAAESAGGNKSFAALGVSVIPELPEAEEGKKAPVVKAPLTVFFDGGDGYNVYAVSAYQGELDQNFQIYSRADMAEGNTPVSMVVHTPDGKEFITKGSVAKSPTLTANIISVNGEEYMSGKTVVMKNAAVNAAAIEVEIETGAAVSSVTYEITGDEVPGGKQTSTGTAKLVKPTADNPSKWYADISLSDLPVRVNNIAITVKAGSLVQTINGSISVVRDAAEQEDKESVYSFVPSDTAYRKGDNVYVLKNGSKYYFYANCIEPTAVLESETPGLNLEKKGKLFVLSAEKDGVYNNVSLTVTDKYGDVYKSQPVNFLADSAVPDLNLLTPELHQWLGSLVKITGTAVDVNGIKKVEYSFDGETWKALTLSGPENGVTFEEEISISKLADGLLPITLRATDNADQVAYVYSAGFKDVTPPVVRTVEPLETDVVNGENLIVFEAKDNAYVEKAEYSKANTEIIRDIPLNPLVYTLIGTEEQPIAEDMAFTFYDPAGNKTILDSWRFAIDQESDLPRCEIHVPEDNEVITRDFTVSGVVYDDDGDSTVWYSIDGGEYKQVSTNEVYGVKQSTASFFEPDTSFTINVPLSTMTDNEHEVRVYAVDLNGVKGYETSSIFKVSLEEPKGAVELPKIETSVKGNIRISGSASDKNGISRVQISLDNGNSFNDAVGTTEWYYDVDTRVIPGGTQVVFLRVTDGYGIQGLYSSLINIDNDAPVLSLEMPLDDSTTTGDLFFSGYTYDNVEVSDLYVTIRDLEKGKEPFVKNLTIDRIIGEVVSLKDIEDGFYNVELTAKDKAGNVTNVSRNIHLDKNRDPATVDILYPLNGEHKQGEFTIYGQASGEYEINTLRLVIDDAIIEETELSSEGFFKFDLGPEKISEGLHTYRVDSVLSNGMVVPSLEQTITYDPYGPWVTIDNFDYGEFAINRPFIRGRAGYSISDEEVEFYKSKDANPEYKAEYLAKKVVRVDLSFDNGKSYEVVSNKNTWQYRIENQDIPEGYHFMMVRAVMANGEVAITRTIIQVDNTGPRIHLISPVVNGRYNQKLQVSGLSSDDVKLEDVTITLRQGDKSSYEVPGLFQGLYLDFHLMGATLFDVGAGLTFFDNVVKVQFQWGQFTQDQRDFVCNLLGQPAKNMRYGGNNVMGIKILANIYTLPFYVFLGHDFEWLYASFALGAQFTRFNQTGSGNPQILSALVFQLEFPQFKFNRKLFSTMSFYTEGTLWFIPTDVSNTGGQDIQNRVFQIAVGARLNVF